MTHLAQLGVARHGGRHQLQLLVARPAPRPDARLGPHARVDLRNASGTVLVCRSQNDAQFVVTATDVVEGARSSEVDRPEDAFACAVAALVFERDDARAARPPNLASFATTSHCCQGVCGDAAIMPAATPRLYLRRRDCVCGDAAIVSAAARVPSRATTDTH